MDTLLSETQTLLRDSLRDYLAREVSFDRVREHERLGHLDNELWTALQEFGYLALPFPERQGGAGGELTDLCIVIEELSRRAAVVPVAETMAAALTIQRVGTAERAREIIGQVIAGKVTITPAVLEENDSFDATPATVAADGRLSGKKLFVDYGQDCTHHVVSAQQDGEPGLWLVESGAPGVEVEPAYTLARTPQASVTYSGARAEFIAGGDGYQQLVATGRLLSAVQCLGSAQQALDVAVSYVADRVQFGRPLGSFQAVQHHCANMAMMVDAARFLVYEAAWKMDHATVEPEQLALVKAWTGRTGVEVTMLSHQLHGGIGVTEEYDLHFFSRRAKERSVAWGGPEECLAAVARQIEVPEKWV